VEITQKETSNKQESKDVGSLNAFIQKAKADKTNEKFGKYFNSIFSFLFYQYAENFHCKPDTVGDMIQGIKYLYFMRGDK